jgi:hypothetical protein
MFIKGGIHGIDPDVPLPVYNKGQKAIDSYYADKERQWLTEHKLELELLQIPLKLVPAKSQSLILLP